jgi:hypothetical protein
MNEFATLFETDSAVKHFLPAIGPPMLLCRQKKRNFLDFSGFYQ